SDIRNSRVIDIITELKEYEINVIVCDPLADKDQVKHEYGVELTDYNSDIQANGIIIAVNHDNFKQILTVQTIKKHLNVRSETSNISNKGIVIDIKGIFHPTVFENTGLLYWRL
ncbi:MAG: nucleotide sugar dehydrogenase, partial [Candidatus Omnitrophica bacterium]|nr:nucleotide sugar dehydrogenase [Candidatus Omnitrophota bacterium]